jgi:hypothetical protein
MLSEIRIGFIEVITFHERVGWSLCHWMRSSEDQVAALGNVLCERSGWTTPKHVDHILIHQAEELKNPHGEERPEVSMFIRDSFLCGERCVQ